MMISKTEVEKAIRDTIEAVTGKSDLESDASLIDREMGIHPATFLYIFDKLEKDLQLDVCDVLRTQTFQVMTIGKLTDAIHSLQQ